MQEEKKSFKEFMSETIVALKKEIVNKKRWMVCGIEILLVVLLIIIDLLTKKYVYGACLEQGKINIIKGVLSLIPVENTGASFGMLSGKTVYLTVVSVICSVFLFFFIFYSYKRRNLWLRSALILITAGAIGNIVDRIALGYVRDFIYFELINFAVFNFADSCLTVGTIVLLIYILFFYGKEEQELLKQKKQNESQAVETTPAAGSIVIPEAVKDRSDESAPANQETTEPEQIESTSEEETETDDGKI